MVGVPLPRFAAALVVCCLVTPACGQKGPPLAPLHLVPAAVTEVSLRRVDDRARLRFVLPTRNANGPGPVVLDRVEIYAVTVAPGAAAPANRDLLTRAYLVGEIPVGPAPVPGAAPLEGDARPAPGDLVSFDEELSAEKLVPVVFAPEVRSPAAAAAQSTVAAGATKAGGPDAPQVGPGPPPGAPSPEPAGATAGQESDAAAPTAPPGTGQQGGAATPPATAAVPPGTGVPPEATVAPGATAPGATVPPGTAVPSETTAAPGATAPGATAPPGAPPATAVPASTDPVRIYVARGVTRGGRPGPPSARVQVPITPPPPPPGEVTARTEENGVVLEWKPPAADPVPSFNVYQGDDLLQPVNPAPLATASFEHAVAFGEEYCYRVRSLALAGTVTIEGPLSEQTCVTPRDVFPPAAPTGLAVVPTPGQISLIWDAGTEKDLAGYLVLRGDAPDGPMQSLTPAPIREPSYRDATVQPGAQYVYAVVAVDTATPPNMSAMSARVEETAR